MAEYKNIGEFKANFTIKDDFRQLFLMKLRKLAFRLMKDLSKVQKLLKPSLGLL